MATNDVPIISPLPGMTNAHLSANSLPKAEGTGPLTTSAPADSARHACRKGQGAKAVVDQGPAISSRPPIRTFLGLSSNHRFAWRCGYNPVMRTIGIITDAHANLPALEAALAALGAEGCGFVVHTGDAIGIGPHPAGCLDLLLAHPSIRFTMGNHDKWFVHGLPEPQPAWMSDEEAQHQRWAHRQLTPGMREAVAGWPDAFELEVNGVAVGFCHYPRAADGNGFSPIEQEPTAADLDRLFAGIRGDLVFYGHHHPRADTHGRARYVNPGALGCNAPGQARFAILSIDDDGSWNVSLRSAPYDASGLPRDYEERDVPARETILRIFHGVTP